MTLPTKNIYINGYRTSVRMEPAMWEALHEVAEARGVDIAEICGEVYDSIESGENFSSALRVYVMGFFRARSMRLKVEASHKMAVKAVKASGHLFQEAA